MGIAARSRLWGGKTTLRLRSALSDLGLFFDRAYADRAGWLALSLRTALFLLIAASYFTIVPHNKFLVIPKEEILAVDGHMYAAKVPADRYWRPVYGTNVAPETSDAVVFEDDKPLGPQNSRANIASQGRGQFTLYSGYVYFSSSDNGDPRVNGRSYRVTYGNTLRRAAVGTAAVIFGFLIFAGTFNATWPQLRARARGRLRWALFGIDLFHVEPLTNLLARAASAGRQLRLPRRHIELPPALGMTFDRIFARRHGWLVWALRVSLGTTLALTALTIFPRQTSWSIPNEKIVAASGMYLIPVPVPNAYSQLAGDSTGRARSFDAQLAENGLELGPLSTNADIAKLGRGRFSFLNGHLYFSASDNSDPRTNGRSYVLKHAYTLEPTVALGSALIFALLLAAGLTRPTSPAFWQTARTRLHAAVFDTSLRTAVLILVALAAAGLLLTLAVSPDTAAWMLTGLRDFTKSITAVGFMVAAGVLVANTAVERAQLRRLLAALVLCALAYTIKPLQLIVALGPALENLGTILIATFAIVVAVRITGLLPWAARVAGAAGAPELFRRYWNFRNVLIACVCIKAISVLPEVVAYWDQSGWMDSYTYDNLAMSIVHGELPFGASTFMPLYQFGMAAFYWIFGHFFFVQQIVNVLLALAGGAAFTLAVWKLYPHLSTALVGGLFAAHWSVLHHAVWYTQIEGWYVPFFAFSVLALAHYRERGTTIAIAILALTAAAIFNLRLQGAFYAAALGLAPLLVGLSGWRERLKHLMAFGLVFGFVGILPWSARNYAVEGYFSPSSVQSVSFVAILNDPRIPLYGIRYWENLDVVSKEWTDKYPNMRERLDAQRRYFWDRLRSDPGYFIAAAPWRVASFYGLLPGTYFASENFGAPDWRSFWRGYLYSHSVFLVPVVLSLIGLAVAYASPFAWFLVLLIFSNVMVSLTVGSGEPRLCYPVLLLHALLFLATFDTFRRSRAMETVRSEARPVLFRAASAIGLALILFGAAIVVRLTFGAAYAYRAIMADSWVLEPDVEVSDRLPFLSVRNEQMFVDNRVATALEVGKKYSVLLFITNSMFPPKYLGNYPGVPDGLSVPGSTQYFFGFVQDPARPIAQAGGNRNIFPVRFAGTTVPMPLRESSLIKAEITVDHRTTLYGVDRYWLNVDKARLHTSPGNRPSPLPGYSR